MVIDLFVLLNIMKLFVSKLFQTSLSCCVFCSANTQCSKPFRFFWRVKVN